MNYLLGQLEQMGYLLREDDPDDLRSKRVQLTERGEALRRTIRQSVTAIEHELEEELGQVPYSQLRELLLQLNATETVCRQV
jgi:DNA-binding MarR family transcriptional regulator